MITSNQQSLCVSFELPQQLHPHDQLQILRSKRDQNFSKRFSYDHQGNITCLAFPPVKFFTHYTKSVNDIDDLYVFVRATKVDPCAFIVRGQVLPTYQDKTIQRKKSLFIVEQPHRWQCLDIDKLPNPTGCKNVWEAIKFIRSLLPASLRNVRMAWEASSSLFVYGTDSLSFHAWFMTDEPLAERDTKNLHKLIGAHMQKALKSRFGVATDKGIDPKISEAVQPIYTARPTFDDVPDPIPKEARITLDGTGQDFATYRGMLAELDRKPAGAVDLPTRLNAPPNNPTSSASRKKAIKSATNVTQIVAEHKGRPFEYAPRINLATRIVAEIKKVFSHRMARSSHYRKGIPEGKRDTFMTVLLACFAESLTHDEIFLGRFEKEFPPIVRRYTSEAFLLEYVEGNKHQSILERCQKSAEGLFTIWKGLRRDVRYGYAIDRIIEELGISPVEMTHLKLETLCDPKARETFRKRRIRANAREINTAQFSEIQQNNYGFIKICPLSVNNNCEEDEISYYNRIKPMQIIGSKSPPSLRLGDIHYSLEFIRSTAILRDPGTRASNLILPKVHPDLMRFEKIRTAYDEAKKAVDALALWEKQSAKAESEFQFPRWLQILMDLTTLVYGDASQAESYEWLRSKLTPDETIRLSHLIEGHELPEPANDELMDCHLLIARQAKRA